MLELAQQVPPTLQPVDIAKGSRVLVSEYPNGRVWHTITKADHEYVYTVEVPEGFRREFVIKTEGVEG